MISEEDQIRNSDQANDISETTKLNGSEDKLQVDKLQLSDQLSQPTATDITLEVNKPHVSFFRDIAPYYCGCYVFFVTHTIYHYTEGNIVWPLLIAYTLAFPAWGYLMNERETNLDAKSETLWKQDTRFLGPLYAFLTLDWLTWIWCFYVVSETQPFFIPTENHWFFQNHIGDSIGRYFLFVFVWGYMAGVNGLAGHELIHKRQAGHKIAGTYTFTKIFYSHFFYEHNSGHHRHVATTEDPATALKNEQFYSFALRSSIGGHLATWRREKSRVKDENYDEYENVTVNKIEQLRFVLENRMVHFFVLHVGLLFGIWLVFGYKAVLFQLGYASVGVFFIEMINYTEHYGLLRKKDSRGIYEPVGEMHSWNSVSSPLLFRIQRHSDHHMHWYKPYQTLKKLDNAPQMPYDYLYTMLLALCPPLWKKCVNPRLEGKEMESKFDKLLVYTYFIFMWSVMATATYRNTKGANTSTE